MSRSRILADRRQLLTAMGLGGLAHLMPTLRNSAHAAGAIPKRLIIFYTQHGTEPSLWKPRGPGGAGEATETGWTFAPTYKALEPYQKDCLLLAGVDRRSTELPGGKISGDGHQNGQCASLTAGPMATSKYAGGRSIDQHIVEGLKMNNGGISPTSVPSLHLRILQNLPNLSLWGNPYYYGASMPVPIAHSPKPVYDRLFPGGVSPMMAPKPMGPDPAVLRRKSALSFLTNEFGKVGNALGKEDAMKLQAHAALIRDLEQRLDATGSKSKVSCTAPGSASITNANPGSGDTWGITSDQMPRLAAAALACDLTRVVCFQVEEPAPSAYNGPGDIHNVVHQLPGAMGNPTSAGQVTRYHETHAKLFARIIEQLKAIPESDGKTLLDHTMIWWTGELPEAGHGWANCRYILAGGGNEYFKMGRYKSYGNYSRGQYGTDAKMPSDSDLMVMLARATGITTDKFGTPGANHGEIPGLRGMV